MSSKTGMEIGKKVAGKGNLAGSTPFPWGETRVPFWQQKVSQDVFRGNSLAFMRPDSLALSRQDRFYVIRNVKRLRDISRSMELHRASNPLNGEGTPEERPAAEKISLGKKIGRSRRKDPVHCKIIIIKKIIFACFQGIKTKNITICITTGEVPLPTE
ncbi:hypothetical protein F2Q69_00053837 [Brassica cretica]|uniref:Uncharacterized protein n=1 Tax=Brassica cretica TaxID=69181 RepID=A0A8S9MVI5_BRACR|nr:hypothetical protein F2Q69_00053837 [Brassica cretica]